MQKFLEDKKKNEKKTEKEEEEEEDEVQEVKKKKKEEGVVVEEEGEGAVGLRFRGSPAGLDWRGVCRSQEGAWPVCHWS